MGENQLIVLIILVTVLYILVVIFILRKFLTKISKDKNREGNGENKKL